MWKALVLTVGLSFVPVTSVADATLGDAAYPVKQASISKPSPREYAKRATRSRSDYACLVELWTRESNWNHKADNPRSSAYGIAQLLGETSKDPYKQIDKGLRYIRHRYGSACAALLFHDRNGWY